MINHLDSEPLLNLIHLANKYSVLYKEIEQKSAIESLTLINNFYQEYITQYEKKPYSINIIDEIGANENAHSRILSSILRIHNVRSEYFVLKSFFKMLGEPFSNLEVSNGVKVKITNEENRIDIKIRDINYSLIIENKIHGAKDQYRQIERYIETEHRLYKYEQIYILYLTKLGGSPSEDSININLINQFNERYREISYKNDILCWLKTLLGDPVLYKTTQSAVASAAILQYIDHLEGMFMQREGEIEMNREISKWLEKELNINDQPPKSQVEVIIEKNNELNKLSDALNELLIQIIKNEFKRLINGIQINGFRPLKYDDKFGYDDEGMLCFWPEKWKRYCIAFVCCVPKNSRNAPRQLYCGIYDSDNKSDNKIIKYYKTLLGSDSVEEHSLWPWGKYLDYYIPEKVKDIDDDWEQNIKEMVDCMKDQIVGIYKKIKNLEER